LKIFHDVLCVLQKRKKKSSYQLVFWNLTQEKKLNFLDWQGRCPESKKSDCTSQESSHGTICWNSHRLESVSGEWQESEGVSV
jgi:hypothetical protein